MTTKTKGAQLGNTNAQKGDKPADAYLHIRVLPSDKAAWVKYAQGRGGLSAWVIETLNNALIK